VSKKILAENGLLLLVQKLTAVITPLLLTPFLFRALGGEGFSDFAFFLSLGMLLSVFVEYGFNYTSTREVATAGGDERLYKSCFLETQFAKTLLLIPAFFILILISAFSGRDYDAADLLLPTFLFFAGSSMLPFWFCQGIQKLRGIVILVIFSRLLSAVAVFVFVSGPEDSGFALLIYALGSFIPAIIANAVIAIKLKVASLDISWNVLSIRMYTSFPTFMASLSGAMFTHGAVVLLGFVLSPSIYGVYLAIDKLVQSIRFSYMPITRAVYPYFSKVFKEKSKPEAFSRLKIFSAIFAVLYFFLGLIGVAFSGEILNVYLGQVSEESKWVFNVLIFLPLITFLRAAFVNIGLLSLKKDGIQMRLMVSGAIVLFLILSFGVTFTGIKFAVLTIVAVELSIVLVAFLLSMKYCKY